MVAGLGVPIFRVFTVSALLHREPYYQGRVCHRERERKPKISEKK